jgi:hypothetical protein
MGWLFTAGQTRKQLIDRLTEYWEDDAGRKHRCLAHTARGNVLWSVWEHEREAGSVKIIHCDLMKPESGYGWGYKDMSESMGPVYITCPLSYLDIATDDINQEWRDAVRRYNRKLSVGMKVSLVNTTLEWAVITRLRPLIGRCDDGMSYRLRRGYIGDTLEEGTK